MGAIVKANDTKYKRRKAGTHTDNNNNNNGQAIRKPWLAVITGLLLFWIVFIFVVIELL